MDSDSDSSADGDFTTTNVLLGYACKETPDDAISQLGGHPTFLDTSHPPSAALARCKSCRELMPQLLQLHADLPDHFPAHERRLHVWACRRKACKRKPGSVRALRTARSSAPPAPLAKQPPAPVPPPQQPAPPAKDLGTSIFGGSALFGAKPAFSVPAAAAAPASPAPASTPAQDSDLPTTFAAKARLAGPDPSQPPPQHEPWPSTPPAPYLRRFLDADYEELNAPSAAPAPHAVTDLADPTLAAGGAGGKDDFESSIDKAFQRFADRLAQNPEQVLRYEFRGAALLYSRDDAVGRALQGGGMPQCARCGSARVFEVQLVPHAIAELEADDVGHDGMEWGTIVVGVCESDCAGAEGEVVHAEEWAGVQWEEAGR